MKAFVLMPFDEKFDDIYSLGIKEAAKKVSITAKRLDEQIFDTDMLQQIYKEIDKADIIIADMSDRNPNVFYEVGYCDAKKKLVLLLTNNGDDIPFDLKHRPHIIYNNISNLKSELVKKLKWAKKEIDEVKISPVSSSISIKSSDLERSQYQDTVILRARISLQNMTDSTVEKINSIYLHTGKDWSIIYNKDEVNKTESNLEPFNSRHIIQPGFSSIPPSDWIPIDIEMRKTIYSEWDSKDERQDIYKLEGVLKIQVNIGHKKLISDHVLKENVEFFEIPF